MHAYEQRLVSANIVVTLAESLQGATIQAIPLLSFLGLRLTTLPTPTSGTVLIQAATPSVTAETAALGRANPSVAVDTE
jgi:hypothetical protein